MQAVEPGFQAPCFRADVLLPAAAARKHDFLYRAATGCSHLYAAFEISQRLGPEVSP